MHGLFGRPFRELPAILKDVQLASGESCGFSMMGCHHILAML